MDELGETQNCLKDKTWMHAAQHEQCPRLPHVDREAAVPAGWRLGGKTVLSLLPAQEGLSKCSLNEYILRCDPKLLGFLCLCTEWTGGESL